MAKNDKILDDNLVVRKNKDIIVSRYKLKPLAAKLVSTLISLVKDTDTYKQVYVISVSDFKELFGVEGRDYHKKLNEATDDMIRKPLKIEINGDDEWLKVHWCSSIKYKDGLLEFKISEELLPYIKKLKNEGNYLSYDLKHILMLKSSYSIRLYELLKDTFNKNIRYGNKTELIVDLIEFREMFEIPKSYQWVSIKERIFEKAKVELAKHTDIKFDWEVCSRYKRTIKKIKFKIYNNRTTTTDEELPKHLSTFLNYVNYLREVYKNNTPCFIALKIDIGFGNKDYFFGLNNKGYIYAINSTGGDSLKVSKQTAQIIYHASYLCSLYSKNYREFISSGFDIFEFSKSKDENWKIMSKDIKKILKEHDCRQVPMI